MAAIRAWLRGGAFCQEAVLGKLLSSKHPAVAAAEAYSCTKQGVAQVQLGLFARRDLATCEIVCEYQVRRRLHQHSAVACAFDGAIVDRSLVVMHRESG